MRTIIFLFSFLVSSGSLFAEGTDSLACQNYKTGEFYILNGTDTCFITRTKTRQKERCNNSDTEYELIVIWLSDKKYLLRDMNYNPSTKPQKMRKDILMTIMEVESDRYIVHIKGEGQKKRILTVYCNK